MAFRYENVVPWGRLFLYSQHLEPILDELERIGLEARIRGVRYEFQSGGNQMLRVRARE